MSADLIPSLEAITGRPADAGAEPLTGAGCAEVFGSSAVVPLRDGPVVSEAAGALVLALADRGVSGTIDARGRILFGPARALGRTDWENIRRHERDVRAILRYLDEVLA